MEKTIVWYSIQNGGDGSAYPSWFLSAEEADMNQDSMDEGWGEPCTGSVETYVGSDIYNEGLQNRKKFEVFNLLKGKIPDVSDFDISGNNVTVYVRLTPDDKEEIKSIVKEYDSNMSVTVY